MTTSEINDDLDFPVCNIEISHGKNLAIPLIKRDALRQKLTKNVVDDLKMNGLIVKNGYKPSQLGATGGEWFLFLQVVNLIIQYKQYLMLVISLGKLARTIYIAHMKRFATNQKPQVMISLDISSSAHVSDNNFHDDLAARLSILWQAADTEARRLSEAYPMFKFGISVSCSTPQNGFSLSYNTSDCQKTIQSKQVFRALLYARYHEGLSLHVINSKLGLIKYTVTPLQYVEDFPDGDNKWILTGTTKSVAYYVYISTNIIGGFTKKIKSVKYASLKSSEKGIKTI